MTSTLAASIGRLMTPPEMTWATLSFQKAMAGFITGAAFLPLQATTQNPADPLESAAPATGRGLGAVTAQLRAARPPTPAALPEPATRDLLLRIPKGARYLARTHSCAAGSRDYKIYLPAGGPSRPKGLILMLHGCSQTPDDFAIGTRINALAGKHGFAVAYPAQTRGHNGTSCWNWFAPGHQIRGAGEPAILASLTKKLMREFGLGRDAVFVAGLSAGGAMAAILADVYPDVFSAAGIHSGLSRGSARDVVSAMSAMRRGGVSDVGASTIGARSLPVRRIVFQGEADSTVHPSNAAMIVAAAVGDAAPTKIGRRSVRGRGYARSDFARADGTVMLELWMIEGSGHAWSGGHAAGSYTDSMGPDASVQMIRFFLANPPNKG